MPPPAKDAPIRELVNTIKDLEGQVAMLSRDVADLRSGMASTTLTAALIERLIERLDT